MPQNSNSSKSEDKIRLILRSIANNGVVTLGLAPFINPFFQASVMACKEGGNARAIVNKMYQGSANEVTFSKTLVKPNSYSAILMRGIDAHLSKEFMRNATKGPGLYLYRPYLEEKYNSPGKVTIIYSGVMSVGEMIINPVDTWRVVRQGQSKMNIGFSSLYAGSLGNGVRQFLTWSGFTYCDQRMGHYLSAQGFDPLSYTNAALKAIPTGFAFTAASYPVERVKNELQLNYSRDYKDLVFGSRYQAACKKVVGETNNPGKIFSQIYRGAFFKACGNSVLSFGASVVVCYGKRRNLSQAALNEEKDDENKLSSKAEQYFETYAEVVKKMPPPG